MTTLAATFAAGELFSFFRTPLPDDAPLDPNSALMGAKFAQLLNFTPTSNAASAPAGSLPKVVNVNAPICGPFLFPRAASYVVPADQPLIPLPVDHYSFSQAVQPLLRAGVPIPAHVQPVYIHNVNPQNHDDNVIAISQPSTNTYWEFSEVEKQIFPIFFEGGYNGGLTGSTGGSLPAGVMEYELTALSSTPPDYSKQTDATYGSPMYHRSLVTTSGGTNSKIRLTFTARWHATGYVVYRRQSTAIGGTLGVGKLLIKGNWNAPTNEIWGGGSLANGVGTAFDFYYVRQAGVFNGVTYAVGDYVVYNGSTWVKVTWGTWKRLYTLTPSNSPDLFADDVYTVNDTRALGSGGTTDTGTLTPEATIDPPQNSHQGSTATTTEWRCGTGGVMYDASTTSGSWRDLVSGPGSPQNRYWGVSTSRIPFMAGEITKEDFQNDVIDHVMTFTFHQASTSSTTHAYPAQQHDGLSTDPNAPPYGARFRLPASLDLSDAGMDALGIGTQWASTDLRRKLARMVTKALQDYGMILTETQSNGMNIHCRSFSADGLGWRPGSTIGTPGRTTWVDSAPEDPFNPTYECQALMEVPWGQVQVVRMGWDPTLAVDAVTTPCTNNSVPCLLGGP